MKLFLQMKCLNLCRKIEILLFSSTIVRKNSNKPTKKRPFSNNNSKPTSSKPRKAY